MPATPMAASSRYFRRGITVVYWVPTIASKSAPTRSELNAGTDLSGEVADIDGWQVTSNTVDTPALASLFTGKINGATEADNSSLTFYSDLGSVDVRSLLQRGTRGFVVWMDEGDTTGLLMDVFPVQVISAPKQRGLDDPARIMIQFAVTSEPAENVTVP